MMHLHGICKRILCDTSQRILTITSWAHSTEIRWFIGHIDKNKKETFFENNQNNIKFGKRKKTRWSFCEEEEKKLSAKGRWVTGWTKEESFESIFGIKVQILVISMEIFNLMGLQLKAISKMQLQLSKLLGCRFYNYCNVGSFLEFKNP